GVRVGIYKSSTPNMDEGWTRFIFDTFNVPYQSIRDSELKQGSLQSKYDVMIVPSQRLLVQENPQSTGSEENAAGLTDTSVNALKEFVSAGGTLICFDAACDMTTKHLQSPLRKFLKPL